MTKCLKNADGSKMTKNRKKWLKNAKNASKMLKIAQKCNFFSFSTRRFAVALQLLELSPVLRSLYDNYCIDSLILNGQ